jgi:hypothetical protein
MSWRIRSAGLGMQGECARNVRGMRQDCTKTPRLASECARSGFFRFWTPTRSAREGNAASRFRCCIIFINKLPSGANPERGTPPYDRFLTCRIIELSWPSSRWDIREGEVPTEPPERVTGRARFRPSRRCATAGVKPPRWAAIRRTSTAADKNSPRNRRFRRRPIF